MNQSGARWHRRCVATRVEMHATRPSSLGKGITKPPRMLGMHRNCVLMHGDHARRHKHSCSSSLKQVHQAHRNLFMFINITAQLQHDLPTSLCARLSTCRLGHDAAAFAWHTDKHTAKNTAKHVNWIPMQLCLHYNIQHRTNAIHYVIEHLMLINI